mgnify:CR=1 FL=1
MFRGLSKIFNEFIADLKAGFKYLFSFRKKGEVKNIVTLTEETLKNVDQALLREKNKWMGRYTDLESKYKKLFRDTMKKVEVNPLELIKEQKRKFIQDILERGQKMTVGKNIDVYTRDQRYLLGKLVCFVAVDGYWYLIYRKKKEELDYLKAPSLEELIFNAEALSNQLKHKLLITNFIYFKGNLIRVPKRYEKYV